MARIIWLLLVFSIFVFPIFSYAGVVAPARLLMMDGDILFRTPESDEWLPAAINTPLDEGDSIWFPQDSRGEIQLSDGTIVRLDAGSQLDFIANEDGFTHLHLTSGKLYLRTSQTMTKDSLQIDADDTTVVPAARTRLRIDMLPNSQEEIAIFKGSAYLQGSGSRTTVRSGEVISLEESHQQISPLNPPDNWETWNKAQDLLQSRSAKASTPLPDELKNYAQELNTSGRWEQVEDYGMVWRPTIIVADDWAPYRLGRWIWKNDDYIWVSYESWGWAPYHFGRWTFISGFGWCWIPPTRGDIYWGPGYVGWHRNGSEIGWTPLAPGEFFYGRRHYGKYSININITNVNKTTVVYRNKNFRGGLTIVGQNDFLRGRIGSNSTTHNSSISGSISIGSPKIQPLRETRMPIVKQTMPRIVPPRTNHSDNKELRIHFPRIIPQIEHNNRPQTTPVLPRAEQDPTYKRRIEVQHQGKFPERMDHNEQPPQRHEYRQPTVSQPQQLPAIAGGRRVEPKMMPAQKRSKAIYDSKPKRVWKITTKDIIDEKSGKEEKEHKEHKVK